MQVSQISVCALLSKFEYVQVHAHCATTVQGGLFLQPTVSAKVLYIIVEVLKVLIKGSHTTLDCKIHYTTLDSLTLCDMEEILGAGGSLKR